MLNLFRSYKNIQLSTTTSATRRAATTTATTTTSGTWAHGAIGALGYRLGYNPPPATHEGSFYDKGAFPCYTRQRERTVNLLYF